MIKELKYFFFISVIIAFSFFCLKFYFSDKNIKNSYRSINNIDIKINKYKKDLSILINNTENIIEYTENPNKEKKKYYFWDLIKIND